MKGNYRLRLSFCRWWICPNFGIGRKFADIIMFQTSKINYKFFDSCNQVYIILFDCSQLFTFGLVVNLINSVFVVILWFQGKWISNAFLSYYNWVECLQDLFLTFPTLNFYRFSLSLCFEDINLQNNEELLFILKIVNMVFAVLFTIEMVLKWIAFGLWRYFTSAWTCLDFVIVCVSKLDNKIRIRKHQTFYYQFLPL